MLTKLAALVIDQMELREADGESHRTGTGGAQYARELGEADEGLVRARSIPVTTVVFSRLKALVLERNKPTKKLT
jgi:hypothetical protein